MGVVQRFVMLFGIFSVDVFAIQIGRAVVTGVVEVACDGAASYVGVGDNDVFPGRVGHLVEVFDAVVGKAVADGEYSEGVVLAWSDAVRSKAKRSSSAR